MAVLADYEHAVFALLDDVAESIYTTSQADVALRWALAQLNLGLTQTYTIDDLDGAASTTVPANYVGPLQIGAAGFCALTHAAGSVETNNLQPDQSRDLLALGQYYIEDFYKTVFPRMAIPELSIETARAANAIALQAAKAEDDIALQAAADADNVAMQTAKAAADIALQAAADADNVAMQTAKADDDLALQAAKADDDIALQAARADDDIALQAAKADDDLAMQTAKAADEVTLQAAKAEDDLALQAAKEAANLTVKEATLNVAKARALLSDFNKSLVSDARSGYAPLPPMPTDRF